MALAVTPQTSNALLPQQIRRDASAPVQRVGLPKSGLPSAPGRPPTLKHDRATVATAPPPRASLGSSASAMIDKGVAPAKGAYKNSGAQAAAPSGFTVRMPASSPEQLAAAQAQLEAHRRAAVEHTYANGPNSQAAMQQRMLYAQQQAAMHFHGSHHAHHAHAAKHAAARGAEIEHQAGKLHRIPGTGKSEAASLKAQMKQVHAADAMPPQGGPGKDAPKVSPFSPSNPFHRTTFDVRIPGARSDAAAAAAA